MRMLAIVAMLLPSLASAEELWEYEGFQNAPHCGSVYIDETEIGRPDFQCAIKGILQAGVTTSYAADCQTDDPSDEDLVINVTRTGPDTAIIQWGDFDTKAYHRCPQ